MLKKLFNNTKFIFIFTFIIQAIFYFIFDHNHIAGVLIIPDLGLAPVFGLMFGPVGGLGNAFANLVFEIYEGYNIIVAFMDFMILFFLSIFTYKLWYTTFKRKEINTPKFDSMYNILKFISIMGISSIAHWIFINLTINVYPPFYVVYHLIRQIDSISYILNIFNFSVIFGLFLISTFNILKIPMQSPKKWLTIINIPYKYFLAITIILASYTLLVITDVITTTPIIDNIFLAICSITAVIFILNKFEVNVKIKTTNYSIIEQIILFFLIILILIFAILTENLVVFTSALFKGMDLTLIGLITLALGTILFMIIAFPHIYHIEKLVTNPISELTRSVKFYGKNKKLPPENNLNAYLQNNDEISHFIESFISIDKKIENQLNKIKKTTTEKEKIETEFNVAHNIQSSMIKTDFDEFTKDKPIEIYGFMSPAREVGGDFYDYFDIDDEHIAFVIGDVSGKGVPATLFMVKTMYLINNHSKFENKPEIIYENVNNILSTRNDESLFVTSLYGKLNMKTGNLRFVNAGHNPPLVKQNDKEFEFIDILPNFVLGAMDGLPYTEQEIDLNPGDMIFLYTDGVTEANSDYEGFYGEDQLKKTLNENMDKSLENIIKITQNSINQHCKNNAQFDDITMLMIKYKGENDE